MVYVRPGVCQPHALTRPSRRVDQHLYHADEAQIRLDLRYTDPMLDAFLRQLLGALCHQLPERSLLVQGVPLPLCARCTGLHVAAAFTMLALYAQRGTRRRAGLPESPLCWVLAGLALAWLVDGLNSTLADVAGWSLYTPSNLLRLLSGIGVGVALGLCLYPLLVGALGRTAESVAIARRTTALFGPVLAAFGGLALVCSIPWVVGRTLLLALCALSMLAAANGLVLAPLARPWGTRRWLAVRYWALGTSAALGEIVLLGLARHWLAAGVLLEVGAIHR